ncbi:hypothetical protein QQS21_012531 [Conoideocrella luteorostrata]|uniref:Cytochrome P450 n=1 Tax=Conoideocrella luteorostrata TaxID=1105319 RepID=A0AAJ0CC49_9HYPO|nr:hypothetical protein QQS21_012531 [Conoideocrella luteorostrata]
MNELNLANHSVGSIGANTTDILLSGTNLWENFYSNTVRVILRSFISIILIIYATSVYAALASPLKKVPGPWYAPLFDLHLRYLFAKGTIWKYVQEQHRRHGPVIRLGPKQVWVSDKKAMKDVLATTDLPKVSMYAEISRDRQSPGLFGEIMDESAFGRGFGLINSICNQTLLKTRQDREWAAIPDAIFKGQATRYKAISNLIDERRQSGIRQSDPPKQDILQHMLDEGNRPDTGVQMNSREIIDQMSELLLAGSETTSGTIACLFLELARNPNVKRKLLASLPVLDENDAILSSKTIREDPTYCYLEACIKENLRKHPIASEMGRRTMGKPHYIDDYIIPPFTVVSASYRDLHLNEKYWPDPDRFWPERWLDGEEREGAPEPDLEAYYPFSAGKHSCIGQNFAYAEMRTESANICTLFDVEEVANKSLDFRQFITM